jgi:hypothetical protein
MADLAELTEWLAETTAREHLDRSATLGPAALVEHLAACYRAWPTQAGAMITRTLDGLALKIQLTDANTPEEFNAREGVLDDEVREQHEIRLAWTLAAKSTDGSTGGRRRSASVDTRHGRTDRLSIPTQSYRVPSWCHCRGGFLHLTWSREAMAQSRAAENHRLKTVAYHEAGHAVAAIRFRRAFKSVTVVPGEDNLGHARMFDVPQSVIDDDTAGPDNFAGRHIIEKAILVSLAGPAAEREFVGRFDHRGAGSDYQNCVDLALHLYGVVTAEKFIDFLLSLARDFVRTRIASVQIEAVAEALIDQKTLSARRVKAICDEAIQNALRSREIREPLNAREAKRQEK